MEKKDYVGSDCRAFDVDSTLIKELSEGCFKPFLDFVKTHDELELCFRKNSEPEAVTIYYNNHMVWELSYTGTPSVKISPDHARYLKDWRGTFQILEEYGYNNLSKLKIQSKKKVNKKTGEITNSYSLKETKNNFSSCYRFSYKDVKQMYEGCMKPMMKSYFSEYERIDYFRKEERDKILENKEVIIAKKKGQLEKIRQQEIFTANTNRETGYYIYDMEFSQPFANRSLKTEYSKTLKAEYHTNVTQNEPDMLAIRYKDGCPEALVLIEVKCTEHAMRDRNSGILKHMEGMRVYVEANINRSSLMEHRKLEAYLAMHAYRFLNVHMSTTREIESGIQTLRSIEKLIILTDDAIEYYKDNRNIGKIQQAARTTGCQIMLLHKEDRVLDVNKLENF